MAAEKVVVTRRILDFILKQTRQKISKQRKYQNTDDT